jgi:hypothetical protein
MIQEIITFDLADVLSNEPQLQALIDKLSTKHHAFSFGDTSQLPSLELGGKYPRPMLIVRSERVGDGWPETFTECDVVLDVFEGDFFRPMTYLSWANNDFSVGLPIEAINEVCEAHPLVGEVLVAWVTPTELVVHSIDLDERFETLTNLGIDSWRLGRFIPGDEYVASLKAGFPPLLSEHEYRTVDERGAPLYILEAIRPQ